MSNQITNKDLHDVLSSIKDNHLSHIEKATDRTNWLLGTLIVAVLIAPFIGGM